MFIDKNRVQEKVDLFQKNVAIENKPIAKFIKYFSAKEI